MKRYIAAALLGLGLLVSSSCKNAEVYTLGQPKNKQEKTERQEKRSYTIEGENTAMPLIEIKF